MRRKILLAVVSGLMLICCVQNPCEAQEKTSITIDPGKVAGNIDVKIYGHFLEHIYNSVQAGLWGQMTLNGSLEIFTEGVGLYYWDLIGKPEVIAEKPLNGKTCVRLKQEGDGETGLLQKTRVIPGRDTKNQFIMVFEAGMSYKGSLYLRGMGTVEVAILGAGDKVLGSTTFKDPGVEWKKCEFEFKPAEAAPAGAFRILLKGKGTVDVDLVQMFSQASLDLDGVRPDLYQAVAALKPATIRWPGGCFASRYDWKNGLGPREQRKPNRSRIWGDQDYGEFGINECIRLCRRLNSVPILVVNFGLKIENAMDWLEYCMGDKDTKWGAERIKNGISDPIQIKLLELDNETWGKGVPAYAAKVKEYSTAIRAKYPDIKLIACGSNVYDQKWNRELIEACAKDFDYISLHYYNRGGRDYMTEATKYEAFLVELGESVKASANPNIKIYVSEWNPSSSHNWACGLYTGAILNAFERQGDVVQMSCPALFLRHTWSPPRWDNALINHDYRGWFPAQNYVVMKMYRDHYGPRRIAAEGGEGLNFVASSSEDGKTVFFKALNSSEEARQVDLKFADLFKPATAKMRQVSSGKLNDHNTMEKPDLIKEVEGSVKVNGQVVSFTMPPLSVAAVTVQESM